MTKRYLIVGYTTKDGAREFTSVKGYVIHAELACPSYPDIRKDSLDWANRDGEKFDYFQINFMQFVGEFDYKSFFGIKD